MAADDIWLEYHLPTVGSVTAKLFPLAAKCYTLLKKKGHVERLSRIDQLGVIRHVYQGAHHSRWEYVMTQLALIYELAILRGEDDHHVARGPGLRSNTDFPDYSGGKASGADVMQCWALLLNAGHLDGTFATERALLRELQNDMKKLGHAFFSDSGFHDSEARDFSKDVVEQARLYDMHKAISFFFLFRYCRPPNKDLVTTLIDVLKFYCFDEMRSPEKRANLRRVYRRIRQLCYLAIDSLYAPVPMRLDLGNIFFNLASIAPDLCSPADAPLCSELRNFDELMGREVYFTPRVLLHHEDHAEHIARYIGRRYSEKSELKRHEISDMRTLLTELQTDSGSTELPTYRRLLYLPVTPGDFFAPPENAEDLNNRLRFACGKQSVAVSAVPDARHSGSHIGVGIPENAPMRAIIRCFAGLIRVMCGLAEDGARLSREAPADLRAFARCLSSVSSDCAPAMVENLLEIVSTSNCRFAVRRQSDLVAYSGRGTGANSTALRALSTMIPEKRRHEVETHADALEAIPARGSTISVIAPIEVTRQDGTNVTDIDGFSVTCKNGGLWILAVEAKDLASGSSSAAASQLEQRLGDMGLRQALKEAAVRQLDKGAYVFSPLRMQ